MSSWGRFDLPKSADIHLSQASLAPNLALPPLLLCSLLPPPRSQLAEHRLASGPFAVGSSLPRNPFVTQLAQFGVGARQSKASLILQEIGRRRECSIEEAWWYDGGR